MLTAKLIDTSKCIGCRACQVACKQWNQLPAEETEFTGYYENPVRFTANSWTRLVFRESEDEAGKLKWHFAKKGCMHCTEAACEMVCPAGAISHTAQGAVVINERKCIGCNYCVASCTFQVMAFNQKDNVAQKCTMCYSRQEIGAEPACAKTCPTGAISFGTRSEMLTKGSQRVYELLGKGVMGAQLYGMDQLGGMGVIYALEDTPESYGLINEPKIPVSAYIWNAVFRPLRVFIVMALGFILWENKRESEKVMPKE